MLALRRPPYLHVVVAHGDSALLVVRVLVVSVAMTEPDLDDLFDELQRGRVYECSLRDPSWRLDGLQDGENIYIDPRPAIIETLVHELLHRRKPRWRERRVTLEARRLLSRMGETELQTWWRRYQKIRKKVRPVEVEDE